MSAIDILKTRIDTPGRHLLSGLPQGMLAQVLPEMVMAAGMRGVIQVCVDDQHLAQLEEQVKFHAPDLAIIRFPAWDCLPYDRVSPSTDIVAQRLSALAQFAAQPQAQRAGQRNGPALSATIVSPRR